MPESLRSSMVPPSSLVTSVCTIDSPSPLDCSTVKPGGSPTPSSTTSTTQLTVGARAAAP